MEKFLEMEAPKKDEELSIKQKVQKTLSRQEGEKARKELEEHLEKTTTPEQLEKSAKAGREREETENTQ